MEIFFLFVIFTMAYAIGFDVYQIVRNGKSWSISKSFGYGMVCGFATLAVFSFLVAIF